MEAVRLAGQIRHFVLGADNHQAIAGFEPDVLPRPDDEIAVGPLQAQDGHAFR
jgi:hypothetical protein